MIEIDHKKFVTALNEVAATDSGKIMLACLKDSCQWDETYLSSEDPQVTQFYAAKRGIYGALRKLIKIGYLKEIEFNYKRKAEDGRKPTEPRANTKPSDRPKRAK
jgi:hypothetical protein